MKASISNYIKMASPRNLFQCAFMVAALTGATYASAQSKTEDAQEEAKPVTGSTNTLKFNPTSNVHQGPHLFGDSPASDISPWGSVWYGLDYAPNLQLSGEGYNLERGAGSLSGFYGLGLRTAQCRLLLHRDGEMRLMQEEEAWKKSKNTTFTIANLWSETFNEPTLKFAGQPKESTLNNFDKLVDDEYYTLSSSVYGPSFFRIKSKNWMAGNTTETELLRINGEGRMMVGITDDSKLGQLSGFVLRTTSNPTKEQQCKLFVGGGIRTEYIKVDLSSSWADYVFAKDYQLPTLTEVQQHIDTKGHLPGVPSACEVESEGIDLAEMAKLQMQKIEELTLYILQQEARIKALEAKVADKE